MPLVHTPEAANEKEAVASTKVRVERKCMTQSFAKKSEKRNSQSKSDRTATHLGASEVHMLSEVSLS
jgi:hypothetical protein